MPHEKSEWKMNTGWNKAKNMQPRHNKINTNQEK